MKTTSSAPKGKEKSDKAGAFAKGGSGKMFGKMGVQPSQPGVSAPMRAPSANNAAPKGGSGHMAKQSGAAPAVAGQVSTGGRSGDNTFKVSGGKGHMAPFTGSTTAKPL